MKHPRMCPKCAQGLALELRIEIALSRKPNTEYLCFCGVTHANVYKTFPLKTVQWSQDKQLSMEEYLNGMKG